MNVVKINVDSLLCGSAGQPAVASGQAIVLVDDVAVDEEGNDIMGDDADRRLTPTQRAIRDRCGQLPKRLQRSIDQFRQSVDLPPLWGRTSSPRASKGQQGRPGTRG